MSDSTDKDLPDEQQLDEYLRGGSAVSRQYRQLHSADIPAELDRLVLRQAQEAVKAKPAKSRTWTRWTGPLALAASTVLVVSIVIESGVQKETLLVAPASAPVDTTVELPVVENSARSSAAEKRAAEADDLAADEAAPTTGNDAGVVDIQPVQPPAEAQFAPSPAPFAPEEQASSQDRVLEIQSTAPQFDTTKQEAAPAELERRRQADAPAQTSASAPAPAAPPSTIYSQTRARESDTSIDEAVVTSTRRPEHTQRSAGPRNTIAVPDAAVDSANDATTQSDQPRNYSDPEQWLRDIRQLREDKKHEEADREWLRFRYVFPNYRVAQSDPARGAVR